MRDLEDFERHGDYLVPRDVKEEAERAFEKRSERSQAVDRAMRGSITTDLEKWKEARGRGLDFPGVDTPQDSPPRQSHMDHILPFERARMAAGNPRPGGGRVIMAEDPAVSRRRPSMVGAIEDMGQAVWNTSGEMANVLRPGSADADEFGPRPSEMR